MPPDAQDHSVCDGVRVDGPDGPLWCDLGDECAGLDLDHRNVVPGWLVEDP